MTRIPMTHSTFTATVFMLRFHRCTMIAVTRMNGTVLVKMMKAGDIYANVTTVNMKCDYEMNWEGPYHGKVTEHGVELTVDNFRLLLAEHDWVE